MHLRHNVLCSIAYTDGTERITQLNRSLENNLMKQIEYLTSMLYSQLGITQSILDGTADEKTMLNYYNRTIEPIISAIVDEMKRKFLTKTARSQNKSIMFFRDPFKLVPVADLAEISDKFTRNEIATSNEIRQVIGWKPSADPKSVTGLGPGKANINTTEIATNDGSLFNSSRMPSRNIVISLAYMWKDSIEDVRQLSYKYFPIKKKLTMLIETDNRQAEIEGYVESNDPTIFSKDEGSDISIVCPNPFFYSAGKDGINTTIFYGVEALFEFPFSNESLKDPLLEMGEIKNETEQVVVYNGDAEIGVTITIHAIGEASNITIYNTGTREVMRIDTDKLEKFTGSGIIAGDEIIICTVKGNKSITLLRNGKTTNILNCLDKNADWFQLAKGDNIFAYTAEYGSTNLQFKIENRIVYEGV